MEVLGSDQILSNFKVKAKGMCWWSECEAYIFVKGVNHYLKVLDLNEVEVE